MSRHLAWVMVFVTVMASGPVAALDTPAPAARIRLHVEPLLIDDEGLHFLGGTVADSLGFMFLSAEGGGQYNSEVFISKGTSLSFSLTHDPSTHGHVHLELKRTLKKGGAETALPRIAFDLDLLECWRVTLLDLDSGRGKLVLRVVPVISEATDDEILEGSHPLWMNGATLIEVCETGEDRVIFSSMYHFGEGLALGLPELGQARVAPFPFPDSAVCGWVRGRRMRFELGGHVYEARSESLILPEDPMRPGKGWKLFGSVVRAPKRGESAERHYGSFKRE